MAISPTGAVPVPLSVFGSWVTEVAPEAVPENISPDCADIAYAPGEVGSRPCTDIVLGAPFPAGGVDGLIPTVVYAKSFKTPTGAIKNLYMDSNGGFYVEDLTNSPGTYTVLFTSTPGSTCKSITQFGREYIAISDGLHGSEVPLQWDGTLLRRYTCDGPGAPPTIANLALASSQMAATPNTLTRNANLVTANTATPHNLLVGYQAQISNMPDSNSTDVNQSMNGGPGVVSGDWQYVGTQFRTHFEPVTTALGDMTVAGLGFTIPSAATILGVTISAVLISQFATTSYLSQAALWNSGGQLGTAKTPGTPFTTSYNTVTYGSAGDQWGAALTPAIVNDPTFGFSMAVHTDTSRVFIGQPFAVTVYYTLSGTGTVAFVSSIVINNETEPGLALVTTTEPHGLVPGISVSIVGVEPGVITTIAEAQWSAGRTTITTTASHNLNPGSVVQIAGVTTATGTTAFSFNGTFTVDTVPSPNQITYLQTPITAVDPDVINATGSTGNITIAWPIPDNTPTPTYFNVESAPTPTTFYVAVSYSDGRWTTGTVGFAWEGIFYVTEVVSPTQFIYRQYGPNGATTAIGTVTPFGQAAPGLHLMQVLWLTDEGAIPVPSPPVTIIANGGQYLSVTNIPIGPSYVKARILAFTGAQPNVPGELPPFFYIPNTPQTEGQIIGTATQVNDNTTTSVVLDFSDNTLYAALGISIPGNTLANQIKLDGALGFGAYESRLLTWGQRNIIYNLLNMGFGGGSYPLTPTLPLGWNVTSTGGSTASSNTSVGSSVGGGSAWTNPTNVDSNSAFASVSLSPGGGGYSPSITTGSVTAIANIAAPNDTENQVFSGLPSVAASSATVYVTVDGSFTVHTMSTGSVAVQYSGDSGATWATARTWAATPLGFPSTVVTIPVSGITNINTIQVQLVAVANYGGIGGPVISTINLDAFSVTVGGTGATSQTLAAAVSGLSIPSSATIVGFSISFTGYYTGTAPTFEVALGSGIPNAITLPSSAATINSSFSGAGWTPAMLSALVVNFSGATSGTSSLFVNNLVVTVNFGSGSSGGSLVPGRFGGQAWNMNSTGGSAQISQSFYEDAYGDPIGIVNGDVTGVTYAFRCYLVVQSPGSITAAITSLSTGFSSLAIVNFTTTGWYEVNFSAATPPSIPADMLLSYEINAGQATLSETMLIDTQTPYTDELAYGSYLNNPEGVDGVSGQFGPNNDPSKLMDMGILRDTLYLLTQAPSGRLHETTGSGVTEPSGWQVNEVSADCGILSAISLTHSQADDVTSSGGDDWMAWPTEGGAVIFGGGTVEKISQEIQPNWYDPTKSNTAIQINMDAAFTVWGLNDPVQRLLMFGVPIGAATAPNKIYVLNYRNLNSASAIAGSPPFHPSFAGKLIATDNSRKWAPWNLPMNGAVRMYRTNGAALTLVMLGGNGQAYGDAAGFGNVYTLNPELLTDEDFGQVFPYYVTYFFLDPEKAQALQLKGLRILLAYLRIYVQGVGKVTCSYYSDSLQKLWKLSTTRTLTPNYFKDREFGGGQCTGDRIAIKIASFPIQGTDNSFKMTRLTAFLKDAKMTITGANK